MRFHTPPVFVRLKMERVNTSYTYQIVVIVALIHGAALSLFALDVADGGGLG